MGKSVLYFITMDFFMRITDDKRILPMRRFPLLAAAVLAACSLTACSSQQEMESIQAFAMDTVMVVSATGGDTEAALQEA